MPHFSVSISDCPKKIRGLFTSPHPHIPRPPSGSRCPRWRCVPSGLGSRRFFSLKPRLARSQTLPAEGKAWLFYLLLFFSSTFSVSPPLSSCPSKSTLVVVLRFGAWQRSPEMSQKLRNRAAFTTWSSWNVHELTYGLCESSDAVPSPATSKEAAATSPSP